MMDDSPMFSTRVFPIIAIPIAPLCVMIETLPGLIS
jgi:hypothetical protein